MSLNLIDVQDVPKPTRYVDRFFIHCSASDAGGPDFEGKKLAETVRRWHRARGWRDVGYHYLIDKSGKLVTGRPIHQIPAAQARNNYGTITVMLHGLDKDKFTQAQYDTLSELCKKYNELYNSQITFHGHCEVSAKSCPVIDYKALLQLDANGNLGI